MPSSYSGLVLLDTNILLRLMDPTDPRHARVVTALRDLDSGGATICICPQNMQELRQVATRPVASNGLGWSSSDTTARITVFEKNFLLLPENDEIYPVWKRIAEASHAVGRSNYDVRIVANAEVHNVGAILTFEAAAFSRYAAVSTPIILDQTAV